jgi:hypothetical protein
MTDTLLRELYPTVNRAVDLVLARRGRRREFAQDFRGFVMLKMLERNGRSTRVSGESSGRSGGSSRRRASVPRRF